MKIIGPMEAMAFGPFQRAAAAAATFELRVRLLADQATPGTPVQKAAPNTDLSALVVMVAAYFKATDPEKAYLKSAAVIRNKLLHLVLSRVTGRVVSLQDQLIEEGLLSEKIEQGNVWTVKLDEPGAKPILVSKTSSEAEGIYGWMLEAATSNTFHATVAVMVKGMRIIERLRDIHNMSPEVQPTTAG